jgi:hypothetical protein
MLYPHRIRLRGPWECEVLSVRGGGEKPGPRRVTMPCRCRDVGLAGFAGQVRFTRKFGYPGRIDDFERVWLTCDGLEGTAAVALNGRELAVRQTGPFALEATELLGQRNQLEVTIDAADYRAGLWGEVALEIRCTAFLEDMTARREPDGAVVVTGRLAGFCDTPLELYAIADGAQVHYQTIETRPEGTPLAFTVPPREPAVRLLRVDLVNVSTLWYVWETSVRSP